MSVSLVEKGHCITSHYIIMCPGNLEPVDHGVAREGDGGGDGEVDPGAAGHVVEDERQVNCVGHSSEVPLQALLRRLHVVRCYHLLDFFLFFSIVTA